MKLAGTILLTLLLVGTASTISLYYGELEGKVTDGSGKALSGVTVTVELLPAGMQTQSMPSAQTTTGKNVQTAKSGKNGSYKFVALRPGNYRIQYSLDGLQSVVRNAEIRQSISNTINIVLYPAKPSDP
jgi:Carboxypeptidase regulatory-like domain